MQPLLSYILKVNVVISILLLGNLLLLRKEKFLILTRALFISIFIFAFTLPLTPAINFLHIDELRNSQISKSPLMRVYKNISQTEKPISIVYHAMAGYHSTTSTITFAEIAILIYLIVLCILLLRFAFQLFNVYAIIKLSRKQFRDGIVYCEHTKDLPPFSFFNFLVINNSAFSPEQSRQIIEHEIVHIRQWHSIDILFSELAQIVLWMNPLLGIFKKYVKLNLEYIADESMLNGGAEVRSYQLNLLQTGLNSTYYPLTNLFNSSKLKLRIKMMSTKKSPRWHACKFAILLPLLFAIYFIINPLSLQTLKAQVKNQIQPQEVDSIIGRCMVAVGGRDKINALKTMHMESTITLSNGMSGSSIYDIVYGDKFRHETIIGDQRVLLCESETKGWKMNPRDQTGVGLSKNELAEYGADLYPGGYLFNYVALGNKAELIGQEKVNDLSVYHIKVSTKDSLDISYFIDTISFQVIQEIREHKSTGMNDKRVFEFANFSKTSEGYIMPFYVTVTNPQGIKYNITPNKVVINKEVDPGIFLMPK
jgi:hypothetical protein